MSKSEQNSVELVRRVHAGDEDAIADLVERHLPWVRRFVRRRLGAALRRKGDTMDYVQSALMRVLRYGPRFVTADDGEFRALLGKIVENQLRDEFDYLTAQIRDYSLEVRGATQFLVNLDADRATPSVELARDEEAERLQIVLELLSYKDRTTLRLRQEFDMPFAKIGEVLGVGEDGARKRHDRALLRMRTMFDAIATGELSEVLQQSLGRPLRRRVEKALRALERSAVGRIADESAGNRTIAGNVALSDAIDRARKAFRSVPYDTDEACYLEAVDAALGEARRRAADLPPDPFDAIDAVLAEVRAGWQD